MELYSEKGCRTFVRQPCVNCLKSYASEYSLVSGHLLRNFFCEVFLLLLDAFAGLVTDKALDNDLGAFSLGDLFHILGNGPVYRT